jgi:hypothetical protein
MNSGNENNITPTGRGSHATNTLSSVQDQSAATSTETITQQITDATAQTLRLRLTKNPNKLQRRVSFFLSSFQFIYSK